MGKSTPKAPAAPDPVATAQAQSTMNKETAVANANLNRIDQYTPEGSLTFKQIGVNSDGTPKYESHQQYSAGQQALYDAHNQMAQSLYGLAGDNISRVAEAQSKPFTYDGMTPLQTSVNAGPVQSGYGGYGDVTTTLKPSGQIQGQIAGAGDIQRGLDYSNLTALPGTSDFSSDRQAVADSVYGQATSRLDPQYQQAQNDLAASLAAKGVTENSTAYRNAMDQFARQKTDAYNQANYSAIQAGSGEQSRLFGLSMAARQQGQNEVNTQGEFANAAQGQQFSQNAQSAQFANQAQQQTYDQNLGGATFANSAQGQQYSQAQQNAAFANTAQQQRFAQGQANAALNNTGRQQQIQEAAYLRNMPLNDIASLLSTGGGVQTPQFANYANANVANVDYSGLVQNNYNNQMQQYNTQMANRSSALGSIFGLAGTAAGLPFLGG